MYLHPNPNDVFVFGSAGFVMPNMLFVLLLSANIKANLSRFPHRILFQPIPKWVAVNCCQFCHFNRGHSTYRNCLCTTGMYQICKTTFSSFFFYRCGCVSTNLKHFPQCAMLYYTMKDLWAASVACFWCKCKPYYIWDKVVISHYLVM